ncbi:MAG: helix-turn-helix domain-containing protein, partial [Thermodesulfobacteriota bacterium]|nr:helix-turn-helix domain-containing protein [Thermodesulfobacteriota bacterium]
LLASDKKKRRQAYLRFMAKADSDELLDLFEQKKWPSLLGSEKFISWVKETFFEEKKHRQIPQSAQLAPELEHIKREVCRTYGVEEKDLLTTQRGKSNEPRNVAIYLCRILRNGTLMELGQVFGMTGYSPAGSAVERVKKKLPKDRKLQKRIEKIKQSLLAPKGSNGDLTQMTLERIPHAGV